MPPFTSLHRFTPTNVYTLVCFYFVDTHDEQPVSNADEDALWLTVPLPHQIGRILSRIFLKKLRGRFAFFPSTHRGVDLVTALATPLTYEGLIDDLIGIENG